MMCFEYITRPHLKDAGLLYAHSQMHSAMSLKPERPSLGRC